VYDASGQDGIPGCAYDNKSNLYCDAYSSDNHDFALYEIAKNSAYAQAVSVSGTSGLRAGPMMWDGKNLSFGSGAGGSLYQIALTGSGGSISGSTVLQGTGWVWQYWIIGKRVIAPTYGGSASTIVGYYKYPAGGVATKAIETGFDQPDGAAVSNAKI
jgi:hypothetical protein